MGAREIARGLALSWPLVARFSHAQESKFHIWFQLELHDYLLLDYIGR